MCEKQQERGMCVRERNQEGGRDGGREEKRKEGKCERGVCERSVCVTQQERSMCM